MYSISQFHYFPITYRNSPIVQLPLEKWSLRFHNIHAHGRRRAGNRGGATSGASRSMPGLALGCESRLRPPSNKSLPRGPEPLPDEPWTRQELLEDAGDGARACYPVEWRTTPLKPVPFQIVSPVQTKRLNLNPNHWPTNFSVNWNSSESTWQHRLTWIPEINSFNLLDLSDFVC